MDTQALLLRGKQLIDEGSFPAASAYFEAAHEQAAKDLDVKTQLEAMTWAASARTAARDYAGGIALYAAALERQAPGLMAIKMRALMSQAEAKAYRFPAALTSLRHVEESLAGREPRDAEKEEPRDAEKEEIGRIRRVATSTRIILALAGNPTDLTPPKASLRDIYLEAERHAETALRAVAHPGIRASYLYSCGLAVLISVDYESDDSRTRIDIGRRHLDNAMAELTGFGRSSLNDQEVQDLVLARDVFTMLVEARCLDPDSDERRQALELALQELLSFEASLSVHDGSPSTRLEAALFRWRIHQALGETDQQEVARQDVRALLREVPAMEEFAPRDVALRMDLRTREVVRSAADSLPELRSLREHAQEEAEPSGGLVARLVERVDRARAATGAAVLLTLALGGAAHAAPQEVYSVLYSDGSPATAHIEAQLADGSTVTTTGHGSVVLPGRDQPNRPVHIRAEAAECSADLDPGIDFGAAIVLPCAPSR